MGVRERDSLRKEGGGRSGGGVVREEEEKREGRRVRGRKVRIVRGNARGWRRIRKTTKKNSTTLSSNRMQIH